MANTELKLQIPPPELVDVEKLRVDSDNPNRMSARQFEALKKSIRRWGFVVPIITNRDYLVADGEYSAKWNPPRYRQEQKLPFIPVETEIDQLVSRCSQKISCFLQMLKETAMRPGEAWRLTWKNIDFANKTVTLNNPEKHSNPRQFRISPKLVDMLQNIHQMQNRTDRVFDYASLASIRRTFEKQRKRITFKTCNPRIMQISFKTLRHWKASIEYQKTKDILWVKKFLGHKKLENTMIYTHLIQTGEDTFISRVTLTAKEICELIDKGFEYICEYNGVNIFRKRK